MLSVRTAVLLGSASAAVAVAVCKLATMEYILVSQWIGMPVGLDIEVGGWVVQLNTAWDFAEG